MNLEKVTIQAEGDEGNAFSVLHMSGKVDYTIDSDVKSRIDIHNDIVRQVLLPSFTAQLGAAELGQGESEDDDEAEKEDPEMGLDYDPIVPGNDIPDEGFELKHFDKKTNLIIVKGKNWPEFEVTIKLVLQNGKWLIDGCGVVNIPK